MRVKIVSAQQMRDLEHRMAELGVPEPALMQNAGRAIADAIASRLNGARGRRVLVLCGPGNNGGDGLVAARHLHDAGALVSVCLWNRATEDVHRSLLRQRGVDFLTLPSDDGWVALSHLARWSDVIIDALLGTGRARPIEGSLGQLLRTVAEARTAASAVVAVDVPTGLNADTGEVDPLAVVADMTVTLGCAKRGLFQPPGSGYVGALVVGDIGLSSDLSQGIQTEMMTSESIRALVPSRSVLGHKGTFGRATIVAGSVNYVGAAKLTAASAIQSGAGLVTLATPLSVYPAIAASVSECVFLPLPDSSSGRVGPRCLPALVGQLERSDVVALGPGLGQDSATADAVLGLCKTLAGRPIRLLVDADGLNNLASVPAWWESVPDDAILTPHPAEMGRLLGAPTSRVQHDRLESALVAAAQWKKVVVLKGANTVVAAPDGRAAVCPGAEPALATAGSGDVLAGIITGLLAQGAAPFDAAVAGVWVHWQAAVLAKGHGKSTIGAGDIVSHVAEALESARLGRQHSSAP